MFWGLLRKKSLEEIFNEIWPLARNQSSSDLRRMLDGLLFGSLKARNLWRKSCLSYASQEINHRIFDGCLCGNKIFK